MRRRRIQCCVDVTPFSLVEFTRLCGVTSKKELLVVALAVSMGNFTWQ